MTEQQRRDIAQEFKSLVRTKKVLRKNAVKIILEQYGVSRRSLYRWCKKFGIKTR